MKRLLISLLSSTCLATAAVAAVAQTAGPAPVPQPAPAAQDGQPAATSPEALVRKIKILSVPRAPVQVPQNEPAPLDMSLTDVPGAEPELLDGVTAKAFTRYVEVDGKPVGQLVLSAVTKKEKVEPLPAELFVSQFSPKLQDGAPVLPPAEAVVIEGDQAAMIAALKRLQEVEVEEKEEPEERKDDSKDGKNGKGGGVGAAGSNWKAPGDLKVQEDTEDEEDDEEVTATGYAVSTDACPIRVDIAQGVAIQQSQLITTNSDGSETTEECSDGAERYPLQRSSTTCPDIVDIEGRTATAAYMLYYVGPDGQRVEAQGCQPDPEQVFPIVEEAGTCPVFVNYADMTAVRQTSLVYQNAMNATVTVRGCQPSETETPVAMRQTTEGCSVRHDFAGGTSYQRAKWLYDMDGATYQAGDCTDTEKTYPHQRMYETAAGQRVCEPIVNKDTGTVIQASRIQISVDGLSQFITECTPDTSATGLIATTEGCTNPALWTHDLTAGQSYGQQRFYYTRKSGQREYVTGCQDSAVAYPHHLEIAGWQNHDAELFAYRLSNIYIQTPAGRYDVVKETVVTGTEQMPYVFLRNAVVPSDKVTYEGCDQYTEGYKVEYYQRPDTSEYGRTVGTGAPQGPVNICSETLAGSEQVRSGVYSELYGAFSRPGGTSEAVYYVGYTEGILDKFTMVNTVTGEVVASRCAWNGSATAFKVRTATLSNSSYTQVTAASAWARENGCTLEQVCQTAQANPCPF